jgi:hypothetical protein
MEMGPSVPFTQKLHFRIVSGNFETSVIELLSVVRLSVITED